ncbi:16S rRNA (guanine(527)-N(7))-methyltransferase RsmG [Marivita sp. S2033]|uniref:16S rRNA (guanine(527)-N(7))-methyltransferase RsmG n=1 Tax=Marivita sp. S2033 TaxID=3373187 RepID=UPI003981FFED
MNVSRETSERLAIFLALLEKWSPKINLVSADSLKHSVDRHFRDSEQIARLRSVDGDRWIDFGSGGGFPGAVIAIMKAAGEPDTTVTLVESDLRKATFLRTVSRETGVGFDVLAERIEALSPLGADVITARALAPLSILLGYADRHLSQGGTALFPKGRTWRKEVAEAEKTWRFTYHAHTSETDPEAAILEIGGLSRA